MAKATADKVAKINAMVQGGATQKYALKKVGLSQSTYWKHSLARKADAVPPSVEFKETVKLKKTICLEDVIEALDTEIEYLSRTKAILQKVAEAP